MKLLFSLTTALVWQSYVAADRVEMPVSRASIPLQSASRGPGPIFYGTYAARSLVPGNGSDVPTGGDVWPTAIYWTMVQVGTPPGNYPVAIDSGSGDLDIGGKDCEGCVHGGPNRAYDHTASSTSKPALPFHFSNSYQTCDLQDPTAVCTISGGLYKDQVSLAGIGPVEVTLGSIEKQTTNFDQFKEIDGVMGFTMGEDKNVFASLVKAGQCDNVWSMCMVDGKTSNGTLTVGGVDDRLHLENITYVKDVGIGFHSVQVNAISVSSVNSSSASLSVNEPAILDTGTNVLLLPSKLLTRLRSIMCVGSQATTCESLFSGKCVSMTTSDIASWPSLQLHLSNQLTLDMNSSDYLLRGSPQATNPNYVCLGLRDGGAAGGSGFIIGDTTMRNYYLVFDLEEKQIGWGKVNRDTCGSL